MAKREIEEWLTGDDTGCSSMTIWTTYIGLPNQDPNIPYDPSDFGRCYRLLQLIPEQERDGLLKRVATEYPIWKPLVREWKMMEKLWEEESPDRCAPKLYELMEKLHEESKKIRSNTRQKKE
jgi:hypothetical protein